MEMDKENQDREDELLRASFMGDIREDVQFWDCPWEISSGL